MEFDIKGSQEQENDIMNPLEITSIEILKQIISAEYRILYCNVPRSAPCRNQYSILMQVAESYTGWESIVPVDVEKYPEAAAELLIQSIPTIVVFHRGKEIRRFVGLQSLENLLQGKNTLVHLEGIGSL